MHFDAAKCSLKWQAEAPETSRTPETIAVIKDLKYLTIFEGLQEDTS